MEQDQGSEDYGEGEEGGGGGGGGGFPVRDTGPAGSKIQVQVSEARDILYEVELLVANTLAIPANVANSKFLKSDYNSYIKHSNLV